MSHTPSSPIVARAEALGRLYASERILQVVNVWDVASAQAVAALPATRAIATSGHALADALGHPDGAVPIETTLGVIARVVAAVEVPVTVDLDDGHGRAEGLTAAVIGAGAVGANLEDRLRPLPDAVRDVRAVIRAAEREGVPFRLNARTDAIFLGGGRGPEVSIRDAIERGRAYLAEGATAVFVPGVLDRDTTRRLVDGLGWRRLSVIGLPGALTAPEYEELGVARISYGPHPHRRAMRVLADLARSLYDGATLEAPVPPTRAASTDH